MQPARLRLGQLLVDAHILTAEQLDEVLIRQRSDGRRLGTLLVEGGAISETQLTQVLSQQLSVPWVSLHHIDFSRELLNRIPRDVAEKYCLVPIYVRALRGQGNTLYVAMDDPMHEEAVTECATRSGLPVRAMIAAPTDIRKAIRLYYTASSIPSAAALGEAPRPAKPSRKPRPPEHAGDAAATVRAVSAPPPPPPARSARPPAPSGAPSPPRVRTVPSILPPQTPGAAPALTTPGGAAGHDDGPELEVREIEIPLSRRRSQVQMTLLDGTQINVPTSARRSGETPTPAVEESLSVTDLLTALRAAAQRTDAAPNGPRWEKIVAALISLLMKKHLVFERELLDELKKM